MERAAGEIRDRILSSVMASEFMKDGYDPSRDTKHHAIVEVELVRTTMSDILSLSSVPIILDEVASDIRTVCRDFMSLVDGGQPGPPPARDMLALRENLRRLLRYATGEEEYVDPFVIRVKGVIKVEGLVTVIAASEEEARRILQEAIAEERAPGICIVPLPPGLQKVDDIEIISVGH